MAKKAAADWTIMVFLNAKNNLEPFSFGNFEQMASVGSTDRVNILVEFGRPRRRYSSLFGGWSKTLRFRVTKGMTPTEANALEDLQQVNMGDGAVLADLVTWSRKNFPAKREMLVIWDHGQGWRLQTATMVGAADRARHVAVRRALLAAAPSPAPPLVPEDMRIHGGVRYVSIDEDTGDKLYNRKIQDALTPLAKNRSLDIVSFDACLMAMIETGYALRNVAKVMVASEELEPGAGWNYARWLQPLVDDPASFDAAKLGRAMVTAYHDEYGDNDDTTLSSVDLAKIPASAKALSTFAGRAQSKLKSQLKALKKARAACANYAPGYGLHSIDLGRFLGQVKDAPGIDAGLRDSAGAALVAMQAAVHGNYASATRQGKYGSAGVAIYYPTSKAAFNSDPDRAGYLPGNTLYPVEFVEREAWAKFLQAYLAAVPS